MLKSLVSPGVSCLHGVIRSLLFLFPWFEVVCGVQVYQQQGQGNRYQREDGGDPFAYLMDGMAMPDGFFSHYSHLISWRFTATKLGNSRRTQLVFESRIALCEHCFQFSSAASAMKSFPKG